MTLRKLNTLYEYYQDNYDFKLAKVSYKELKERTKKAISGEWLPD